MDITVNTQYALPELDLPQPAQIESWARLALEVHARHTGETQNAELTVRIVDTEEGSELNQTYRHKSGPTNVLSFPFDAPAEIEQDYLGDVVICAPVVAREAIEQHKDLTAHWAHMVVHGSLHLLGYDHLDDAEANAMEALEINILSQIGYPNPYLHFDQTA